MRRALALAALCLALAAAAIAAEEEPNVVFTLDPAVLGLDETAVLSLEIGARGFGGLAPRPDFQLENFEVIAGPSRSENFRFVNGSASRSVSMRWQLRPLALGKARVHSARVELGDTTKPLPDLEARVEESAPPGRAAAASSAEEDPFAGLFDDLFRRRERQARPPREPKALLQATVEPREPYLGQQVVYSVYLLTQADVHAVQPRELPDFRGFWVRDIPPPERSRPTWVEVGGERYGQVPILRRILVPLSPGRYEISPVRFDLALAVPAVSPLGMPLATSRTVARRTEKVAVEVRPLPPPPPGFTGAVGELALEASLDPTEVATGEAVTLTVKLAGSGHLAGLPDLAPAFPSGLRPFPPQSRSREEVVRERLSAERSWSWVLVPQEPGRYALPAVTLPYFDPEAGRFRTASASPAALTARRHEPIAETALAPPTATAAAPAASAATTPWIAAALGAVGTLGLLGVAVLIGRLRHGTAAARGAARALLAELAAVRREDRPRAAAGRIEDAWRGYLTARYGLPASSPTAQWAAELGARGLDGEAIAALVALVDDLHYLRFAPELADTDTFTSDLVERSRALLKSLR